jgi:hypothetical protein
MPNNAPYDSPRMVPAAISQPFCTFYNFQIVEVLVFPRPLQLFGFLEQWLARCTALQFPYWSRQNSAGNSSGHKGYCDKGFGFHSKTTYLVTRKTRRMSHVVVKLVSPISARCSFAAVSRDGKA